jgi:hypothetical protein
MVEIHTSSLPLLSFSKSMSKQCENDVYLDQLLLRFISALNIVKATICFLDLRRLSALPPPDICRCMNQASAAKVRWLPYQAAVQLHCLHG